MKASELVEAGVTRMRLPHWANPEDHIEVDKLENGMRGPWVHFHSPELSVLNMDNPMPMLWSAAVDADRDDWEPYEGGSS